MSSIYDYMTNILIYNKNHKRIGTLSNGGADPQAPYYDDLYVQELDTGADTFQFSTMSTPYTQDLLEIGNHIMITYKNRNELFTITSLEYSHNEGYKTIGVYAEGIGFDLLEVFMERPEDNGSSSGGGNDSDGDGDDNTDDEYADPDDVYIDENGNIIYDKYGQDDYADPDNVSIDGDGNIIYRRSKNNKKNDSLEFKNISYPRFLSIVLKGTGWSYIAQPGLESVKHDITVKYDRNIYAVLQDSMQSYRGVELEFVHEYNGGRVQKVIKAYKDGGRGSFVGKRFEYGKNVRGITKTQEVANSEDDTVLYIDNIGVDVRYDVDFALKSAEVPEIEIGDTHYVVDKDFYPPMTIKARIGKIEVSFSDPTVNKIYLANNKRISGSAIEDEFNEDDIKDIIDDYDDDIVDPEPDPEPEDPSTPMAPAASSDNLIKAPRMHAYEFLLYTNKDGSPNFSTGSRTTDYSVIDSPINEGEHPTSEDIYNFLINEVSVFDVSYRVLDYLEHVKQGTGVTPSNYCLRITPDTTTFCTDHSATDYMGECSMSLAGSRIFSDIIDPSTDRPDFEDGLTLLDDPNNSNISNDHHDKHMLDVGSLACGLVSALQYHIKNDNHGGGGPFQMKTDSDNSTYYYTRKKLKIENDIELIGDLIATEGFGHIKCRELHVSGPGYIFSLQYGMLVNNSDRKLKENIRYIDAPTTYSNEDLLEKADLHDFIVNQVNICEYNFIGDNNEQIGFIANDYEDTKVGDKIVLRNEETDTLGYNVNNLLFATIGALQEEVRIKDEKIASLENRLAAIEKLLGIDNND